MNDAEALLDQIISDPLARARSAGDAIGFVGADIPEDLLAAIGRGYCHLPWKTGRATPRADQWLESSFPSLTRSILEDWAEGRFDFMEAVVFTRGEDSIQRLYYYISELQRRGQIGGPEPLMFDIAKIDRPSSIARTVQSVRSLAERFGLDSRRLREGMAAANQRRAALSAFENARLSNGPFYEKLARAGLFSPVEQEIGPAPGERPARRVLLAGTPPPDGRFHEAVETSGWTIAAEAHVRSLDRLGPIIKTSSADPAQEIGAHAHALQTGSRGFGDSTGRLIDRVHAVRADAVIIWMIEEEEALGWDLPAQQRALAELSIPTLILTRRKWDGSDGSAEEMVAFVEGLDR